eukprot:scaffold131640_cov26-Tisochrysis_lutea.AAC.4
MGVGTPGWRTHRTGAAASLLPFHPSRLWSPLAGACMPPPADPPSKVAPASPVPTPPALSSPPPSAWPLSRNHELTFALMGIAFIALVIFLPRRRRSSLLTHWRPSSVYSVAAGRSSQARHKKHRLAA